MTHVLLVLLVVHLNIHARVMLEVACKASMLFFFFIFFDGWPDITNTIPGNTCFEIPVLKYLF
jgi:hypothetical protein